MSRVVVVTDSTATIPQNLIEELDIRIVPEFLLYGSESYRDGVDITPGEVYERLRAGSRIPTSAAPSIGDFVRVFAQAAEDATGILSIHMSPRLSATYGVACTASELLDTVPIRVFDCNTAAMGQGFVAIEAARAAMAGGSLDKVVSRAEQVASKTHLLFILDTFKYLRRGGRIGGAAALAGTLLQIKPVLCLEGGYVNPLARTRSKARALRLIMEEMARNSNGKPLHAAILHADAPDEADELRRVVEDRFDCSELYVTEFTPVMGAHTGPGLLGVAFYAE